LRGDEKRALMESEGDYSEGGIDDLSEKQSSERRARGQKAACLLGGSLAVWTSRVVMM